MSHRPRPDLRERKEPSHLEGRSNEFAATFPLPHYCTGLSFSEYLVNARPRPEAEDTVEAQPSKDFCLVELGFPWAQTVGKQSNTQGNLRLHWQVQGTKSGSRESTTEVGEDRELQLGGAGGSL